MKKSLIVAGILLAGSTLVAGDRYYVGMNYSSMTYETGVTNTTGTAQLDEKDNAFKFFAGYEISDNIALEAHIADFGEASLSGNTGDRFTYAGTQYQITADNAKISIGFESVGIGAVLKHKLHKYVVPYAKIGIHNGEINSTFAPKTEQFSSHIS